MIADVLRASLKRMSLLPTIIASDELRADGMILALRDTEAIMQDGCDVAGWQCVSRPLELGGEGYLTLLLWCVSLIAVP